MLRGRGDISLGILRCEQGDPAGTSRGGGGQGESAKVLQGSFGGRGGGRGARSAGEGGDDIARACGFEAQAQCAEQLAQYLSRPEQWSRQSECRGGRAVQAWAAKPAFSPVVVARFRVSAQHLQSHSVVFCHQRSTSSIQALLPDGRTRPGRSPAGSWDRAGSWHRARESAGWETPIRSLCGDWDQMRVPNQGVDF